MAERLPNSEEEYYREVRRILSDTALVSAGAEFENDRLLVPAEHIERLAREDPESAQEVPDDLLLTGLEDLTPVQRGWAADKKLKAAKMILRRAYIYKRLTQAVEQLDPNRPAAYLQTVRDFMEQDRRDEQQSRTYQLGHAVRLEIEGNLKVATEDIRYILPHRDLAFRLSYWYEAGSGEHPPPHNQAEDGFINHALGLYGITAHMALHAKSYGILRPAATPISLSDLPETQRHDILHTALDEWREFVAMLPPGLRSVEMRSKRPLFYRNIGELYAAYNTYPQIARQRIASGFIWRPVTFHDQLSALAACMAKRTENPELPTLTARGHTFRNLAKAVLSKKNKHAFSADLSPGETVYPEKLEGIDLVIFSALARLEARARQLYGKPFCDVWKSRTTGGSTAERIKPKGFYGKLVNPRVVILPVDDEFVTAYLRSVKDSGQIDRDSIVRLNAVVDMQSTGKGIIGQSLMNVVIYTRNIADVNERHHILDIRNAASGHQVARYLNIESSEHAKYVLARAMNRPLSAGAVSPR